MPELDNRNGHRKVAARIALGGGLMHPECEAAMRSQILTWEGLSEGITLRIVQGYSDRTCVTLITRKFSAKYTYLCTRAQSTLHEQRALRRSSMDDG